MLAVGGGDQEGMEFGVRRAKSWGSVLGVRTAQKFIFNAEWRREGALANPRVLAVIPAGNSTFPPGITHKPLGSGRMASGEEGRRVRARACSEKSLTLPELFQRLSLPAAAHLQGSGLLRHPRTG